MNHSQNQLTFNNHKSQENDTPHESIENIINMQQLEKYEKESKLRKDMS